jgi:PIN domain nuclease of toxin-antitoxin system
MNKYLLDTHVAIWMIEGNIKGLGEFKDIILDKRNLLFVSLASYWEIVIKSSIGKLKIVDNLKSAIEDSDVNWLDITFEHIDHVRKLPLIHHDPFDRLIVAQSKVEDIKLLTRDSKMTQYL